MVKDFGSRGRRAALLATVAVGLLAGVANAQTGNEPSKAPAVAWPKVRSRVAIDPAQEARISRIMARMTVEEKVAQTIQPDISTVTPADVKKYKFGSILAGGNSSPGGNEKAPAPAWLKLADDMWKAADSAAWAGDKIPLMWGIDAVHGHGNIIGATLFPQNIGLGAMRDPELIRKIGEVTAREMTVTGIDWDFSPTLAVVRDDRWGRTYEGFAEDPEVVRTYAGKMVEGLQGTPGTKGFLGAGRVIATAKHFVGDGGTDGGKDQGDNLSSPTDIRDIHGAGYPPAIEAGVQAVMASYSTALGQKMHGNAGLLTGALKGDMAFNGLVVGDWNGHGQVPGCSTTSCAASMNAGLDMFMAPDSWKGLYESTLAQAKSGQIPMARLDDAVRRILRVKLRAGLFEKGAPSIRPLAGQFNLLGSADHRAVARQAVRESLVLLKNQGHLLPLSPKARVLVAGDGADNISKQSGGWTVTWQGSDLTNADFPNADSIYAGIRQAVTAAGGSAALDVEGRYTTKPDVAIVVFGENPYAEMVGDRPSLEYSPTDKKDLELLRKLKGAGIPTVAVFLSGRPMWVNPELNASDAFVAAFLPGSEGGGIADVLFKDGAGRTRHDFRGKLGYSWPKRADQTPLNRGQAGYDPLFAYGFGLTYADRGDLPTLSETKPARPDDGSDGIFFARGTMPAGWRLAATAPATVRGIDRRNQEDARIVSFTGAGAQSVRLVAGKPLDLSRETNAQLSLLFDVRRDAGPSQEVMVGMTAGKAAAVPIGGWIARAPVGQWQTISIPLGCLQQAGADVAKVSEPFVLSTSGTLRLGISDIRIASSTGGQSTCAWPK